MDDNRPLTWAELLVFALKLPAEKLDRPVCLMREADPEGEFLIPIRAIKTADEDWLDHEVEGPETRSRMEELLAEDELEECEVVVRAGDPVLYDTL